MLQEIGGRLARHHQLLSPLVRPEAEQTGVQHQPVRRVFPITTVQFVPDDRVPRLGQVDTDLVPPPFAQLRHQERRVFRMDE